MSARVEYRAGWVDEAGEWHLLTSRPTCATQGAAQAELDKLVEWVRQGVASGLRSPVSRALAAGRGEVRSRVVTTTPWEVPAQPEDLEGLRLRLQSGAIAPSRVAEVRALLEANGVDL